MNATRPYVPRRLLRVPFLFALLLGVTAAHGEGAPPNSIAPAAAAVPRVALVRTPDGGIQPQAAIDSEGTLHLIYFKGDPSAGDIYYVRKRSGDAWFSAPLRVNSQSGSAIALGTIRGAQIAIGKNNSVHVAWNGSNKATPGPGGTPMLYARLNDDGTAFSAQRNLVTWAGGLNGGGTVAADKMGDVYVAWHATAGAKDESGRAVFLATSTDDGRTFSKEKKIDPTSAGACGCCQMRAFADSRGTLYVFYRSAAGGVDRDSTLLVSTDKGATFKSAVAEKWRIGACPMTSYAFAENPDGVFAAWETEGRVNLGQASTAAAPPLRLAVAPGRANPCKHPALAEGSAGDVLLVWDEGTSWAKGGDLAWQIYNAAGRPVGDTGRARGVISTWSLATAVATPNGFTIIY